jgi:GNAT superfamily N-acetyltransferase
MTRVAVRPMGTADIDEVDLLWRGAIAPFAGASSVLTVAESLPVAVNVAEEDGRIVGYASLLSQPTWHGTHAPFRVRVAAERRGTGIGRALWAALEPIRDRRADPLITQIDRDDSASRETARRHGGVEDGLHLVSILDLAHVAGSAPVAPDPRASIRVPDLHDAPQRDLIYDLLIERAEDAPDVGEGNVLIPRAQFDAWFAEPWQALVLQVDGQDAGITIATGLASEAHIAFTGVAPAVRGRGLATWIKRCHAIVLRDRGFRTLRTENMSTNAAILAVNARAGFRQIGGFFDVLFDA